MIAAKHYVNVCCDAVKAMVRCRSFRCVWSLARIVWITFRVWITDDAITRCSKRHGYVSAVFRLSISTIVHAKNFSNSYGVYLAETSRCEIKSFVISKSIRENHIDLKSFSDT